MLLTREFEHALGSEARIVGGDYSNPAVGHPIRQLLRPGLQTLMRQPSSAPASCGQDARHCSHFVSH
jgi:hypothetical protein